MLLRGIHPCLCATGSTLHESCSSSELPLLAERCLRHATDGALSRARRAEKSASQSDPETAFIRAETVLKLLRDVLPRHHRGWQSLALEERSVVEHVLRAITPLHSSLRAFLLSRTSRYNARVTSDLSTSASPALMLRNTISAASDAYVDSTARGYSPAPSTSTLAARTSTGPPRVNKLRSAHVASTPTDNVGAATAALPAPGEEDDASPSLYANDPLTSRQDGRRIPRLAETLYPAVPTLPAHPMSNVASGPLPLPGEGDSDDDVAHLRSLEPTTAPLFVPQAYPTPPIPPTPPPSVLRRLAASTQPSPPKFPSPSTRDGHGQVTMPPPAHETVGTIAPAPDLAESLEPLRKVLLPLQLVRTFVDEIAVVNTRNAIETCGLLLGVQVSPTAAIKSYPRVRYATGGIESLLS